MALAAPMPLKKINWFDVGISAVISIYTGGTTALAKSGADLGKFANFYIDFSYRYYWGRLARGKYG